MTAAAENSHRQDHQVQFKPHSTLILCRKQSLGADGNEEGKVFEKFIDFYSMKDDMVREKDDYSLAYARVEKRLDGILHQCIPTGTTNTKLVILFDEAHNLLESVTLKFNEKEVTYNGLLFRLIRVWLAKRRSAQVLGVFAGTSGGLRNHRELDKIPSVVPAGLNAPDSRELRKSADYHERGSGLFDEFFTTTTIGCLRDSIKHDKDEDEYIRAIPYGRPFFARMQEDKKLTEQALVARDYGPRRPADVV